MADQCRFIASFEKTPASQHYIFSHSTKWTLTTHRKPKAHYRTQVQLLQKMLTILQMHWTDSQFFLQTYKYHTAYISTLSQDKKNVLCMYITNKHTLGQHYNSSDHYDKNDEKFGCGEEVLHEGCQFHTQAVDSGDQHWEDMITYESIQFHSVVLEQLEKSPQSLFTRLSFSC